MGTRYVFVCYSDMNFFRSFWITRNTILIHNWLGFFNLPWATKENSWLQTSFTPFKNWSFLTSCLWQRAWVNISALFQNLFFFPILRSYFTIWTMRELKSRLGRKISGNGLNLSSFIICFYFRSNLFDSCIGKRRSKNVWLRVAFTALLTLTKRNL